MLFYTAVLKHATWYLFHRGLWDLHTSCWFSNIVIRTVFYRTIHLSCWFSNFVLSFALKQLCTCFPGKVVCTLIFSGRILLTYIFIELAIYIPFSPWYGRTNKMTFDASVFIFFYLKFLFWWCNFFNFLEHFCNYTMRIIINFTECLSDIVKLCF